MTKPSVILKEKKHLSSVLVPNGYPSSFVQKITKARTVPRRESVAEFKSTAVLPYVQGVSEPLHHCLEQQGICTVFKFNTTLSSPSIRVNKMGWYTGFPVSLIWGKQGDPCRRELKSMTGIYDWPVPRPPLWDEVKFIDQDSPGIPVWSRKLST